MLNKLLKVKLLLVISISLAVLSLSILILPYYSLQCHLEDYLINILFALLLTGLIGYFSDNKQVVYIAFISGGLLSLYLKTTSSEDFILPKRNTTYGLKVAEINLNTVDDIHFSNMIAKDTSINIIVLLQYTPDWDYLIRPILEKQFPYQSKLIQLEQHGSALYSKIPILKSDTFMMGNSPALNTSLSNKKDTIQILSIMASEKNSSIINADKSLIYKDLINFIAINNRRTIVAGMFNHTYWSSEIVRLKTTLELKNSRRVIYPNITSAPRDYFFYTNDLECYFFDDILYKSTVRIGSVSGFQIKQPQNKRL